MNWRAWTDLDMMRFMKKASCLCLPQSNSPSQGIINHCGGAAPIANNKTRNQCT